MLINYPTRPPSKLSARWQGPFVVVDRQNNIVACQSLIDKKVQSVHRSRIKIYNDDLTENPLALAASDADEFVVEKIADHRGSSQRSLVFRVRWAGYGEEDDSWLPFADLKDVAALDDYKREHPQLPL